MNLQEAFALIQAKSGINVTLVPTELEGSIQVDAANLHALLAFIKSNQELGFRVLASQTGVHAKTAEAESITLYYFLVHHHYHCHIAISCKLGMDKLEAPSVCDLWPAANWLERETFDLLGVRFTGHPNLQRIMLPHDWVGHPLRKDYVKPEFYHDTEFDLNIDNRPSEIAKSFIL